MIKRCLILLLTVLCLGASNVSARVCFLPDSDDCGQGEITNMTVTCESQGGYDTEDKCSNGKKTSQICYPNNDCYYRKCQYDSKANCEKHVNINRYKCLSETVDDTTCYYAVAKSCSEIDSEYKSSYYPKREVVDDTIIDANGHKCYKTHKKRCDEINTNYRVACPSLGGRNTGVTGSDGACLICYTCADKGYNEIGLKNLNCWDCEKCPIGLTFKCSVKKDLATSEYKIVSSIGSRLDPNAQICLKKNCADKFLKTEKSCASKNLAFIPSKPAVRASDGVCGTCTLKTCKQQDLVAKTDCDTKNNTFTENKSVTASDAPCGTCTPKNTPKYDTYTIYAKVKCAGPYEEIKKCKELMNNNSTHCENSPRGEAVPENCWYDKDKAIQNKTAAVEIDDSRWSWGHSTNDVVCPVTNTVVSGGGDILGQRYSAGYVDSPAKCISSISLDEKNVGFLEINSENITGESTEVKKIYDTLNTDEQLIVFTLQAKQLTSSNVKLAIKPLVSGNNEIYTFDNYKELSTNRESKRNYEYAFAGSFDHKMIIGGRIIDINLDLDKESQYIGDLPTIYPVIRLKATTRQISDSDAKYEGYQYITNKDGYDGMFIYPYYRDTRFYYMYGYTPSLNGCKTAIIHSVGASRNILSTFSNDDLRMNKGDVFVHIQGSSACRDPYDKMVREWIEKDWWDPNKGIHDCNSFGNFWAAQAPNLPNNLWGAFRSFYCQYKLTTPFESGYVNIRDGAIYIFEDGFDTEKVKFEEPFPELSQDECEDVYVCEKHGLISEDTKSHDDSDNPKYINYQEVDVGCEKKCYKATINDCTDFSTQDYLTWGIPETTTNSEWSAPVWVSAGENNETVCRNELEKDENYREDHEYSESTEISVGSKKCVFCYYK